MASGTIALIALGVAVAGTTASVAIQQRQASAQKKSAKEQQRSAKLQANRQRRQTIRQARIARGQTLNVAGQVGAQGSGLSGGLSSLGAQVGSNLGFNTQTEQIGNNIFKFNRQAAKLGSLAGIAQGVASIGGAVYSNAVDISGAFGSSSSRSPIAARQPTFATPFSGPF